MKKALGFILAVLMLAGLLPFAKAAPLAGQPDEAELLASLLAEAAAMQQPLADQPAEEAEDGEAEEAEPQTGQSAAFVPFSSMPGVFINQIYGLLDTEGSISHGFVELYNYSSVDVSLDGYSLQYAHGTSTNNSHNGFTNDWAVLDLTGKTIKSRQSFLIRSTAYVSVASATNPTFRYTIANSDMDWSQPFSNRAMNVALVLGLEPLSPVIEPEESLNIVDLVGAVNSSLGDSVSNYVGSFIVDVSKQKSARRVNFSNNGDNRADFEVLDYRTITNERLAQVKPRISADGVWGADIVPPIPEDRRIIFSHAAGLYSSQFSLTLSTGYQNAVIRYTTNGNDPTASSTAYSAPISIQYKNSPSVSGDISRILNTAQLAAFGDAQNIDAPIPKDNLFRGNVIKARVFAANGMPLTGVVTRSFIVNPSYGNLPIVSVVVNRDDFFDTYRGIYVNTVQGGVRNFDQEGADWERPCHVEFFEPDGSEGFSQYMGVRIHGGLTRRFPQKTLRFYARADNDPGKSRIEYDVFAGNAQSMSGDPITSFKRILLRNGGNDNEFTLLRDSLIHSMMHGLNAPAMDYRPAVMLLNGEFWGIYNIRERIDEYYIAAKYNLTSTNNIMLFSFFNNENPEDYSPSNQEMAADYALYQEMRTWFNNNTNLSSAALYDKAQTFFDIDNFIDYYIVQTFTGNIDWPSNNNVIWRYQTASYPAVGAPLSPTDGRWRHVFKDLDFSLGMSTVADNPFNRILTTTNNFNDIANAAWATLYFRRLCTNASFVDKFIVRYFDLMNTYLHADVFNSKLDNMVAAITQVVPSHSARWDRLNSFSSEVTRIRTYVNSRFANVTNQMRNTTNPISFRVGSGNRPDITLQTNAAQGYFRMNTVDILPQTPTVSNPGQWQYKGWTNTGQSNPRPQVITAIPYPGYVFDRFVVGTTSYTANPLSIVINNSTTIRAEFKVGEPVVTSATIAEFEYTPQTANTVLPMYPATGGARQVDAKLEFYYATGAQASLGRAQTDRAAVNCPNTSNGWYIAPATSITANNSAGWIITLNTLGYKNIKFTAEQASSTSGPGEFKLAYRLGTTGDWTTFGGTGKVSALSDDGYTALTFNNIVLPPAMEGRTLVQLKVYISSDVARIGGVSPFAANNGNTSINKITFVGDLKTGANPALGGAVTISGAAKFGQTLTAVTSGLTSVPTVADKGTLIYEWKRGELKVGADSATYTLVEADIGQTITVTVSASKCDGSVTSAATAAVAKSDGPLAPAAPTMTVRTDTTITLAAAIGMEYYMLGSGVWQDSATFDGLAPNASYTFMARIKETATACSSANSAASAPLSTLPASSVIAAFNYTPQTANTTQPEYPATGGTKQAATKLELYYSNGTRANIGRTQGDRSAVNCANNNAGWYPTPAGFTNASTLAGWVITLNTVGYKNIRFSAEQASSANGPGEFKLAYRIGTSGDWTTFGNMAAVSALSDDKITGLTFSNVALPAAMENQAAVQLKVYISSDTVRIGGTSLTFAANNGNTSINNVAFTGESSGAAVTGSVRSYNPGNATTIKLSGEAGTYETTIATASGSEPLTQPFRFDSVAPGTYTLVISKPAHTLFTVRNVVVGAADVDLNHDSRPAVRVMTLLCGDINGDSMINDGDLTALWRNDTYNKSTTSAFVPLADLNGDGMVNDADLTILWRTDHYNKGVVIID